MRKVYKQSELDTMKKELTSYSTFKHMDPAQQAELIKHWTQLWSIPEISEYMGKSSQTFYNLRSKLRNKGFKVDPLHKKRGRKSHKKVNNVKTPQPQIKNETKPATITEAVTEVENKEQTEPSTVDVVESEELNEDGFLQLLEKVKHQLVAPKEKPDGFSIHFNGQLESAEVAKRLKKMLRMIDVESSMYDVRIELVEITEEQPKEIEKTPDKTTEQVNDLKEQIQKLHRELDSTKKEDPMKQWKDGYNSLASEKNGLHHPESEYELNKDGTPTDYEKLSTKKIDGKIRFQLFYICPKCKHKGKHFVNNGRVYVSCHECGHRMRTREATNTKKLETDHFGNYYIAGDFKRADERLQATSH